MKNNANGLMGDLESIKALLEEEDDDLPSWDIAAEPVQEVSLETPAAADLPTDNLSIDDLLVKDVATDDREEVPKDVRQAQPDALLNTPQQPNTAATAAALDALLGTEFHNATANVMARARGLIEQHPNEWSPQQTDELSDALRVRIDGAVQQWITASLSAHAGELQQRLLTAVRDELARHLEAFEIADDSNQP